MTDLFFSTMKRLRPVLLQGDLESCEREVAVELRKLPPTPFHLVLDLSITNDPAHAARHFDRFFMAQSKRFPIGAAYTEMNGFDINPDRWYCDLFAYSADGGHDEHDWLSDWQSTQFDEYEINGLEPLQRVYASDAFSAEENSSASYMSSLMVVVKFQRFMQRAAAHMRALSFPLYVTAHDFDFIAEFDPRPEASRTRPPKKSAEELTSELIAKLHDENPHKRSLAVTKLYGMGPAARLAVTPLIERLDDPHLPTRQNAAAALTKIDPMSDLVVSALVAKLKQNQPSGVRKEIVRALGSSPTRKAVDALADAVFDDDPLVRYYSVIALKVLGAQAKDAAPALQKLMETETDELMRSQAAVALERMRE